MAKDIFHNIVKAALEKDGWTITHDPYVLETPQVDYKVDLGARKLIAATKEDQKIAIEVKSFLNISIVYSFHNALGQFLIYKLGLEEFEKDRVLYLALTKKAYLRLLKYEIIQKAMLNYQLKLIVFDEQKQKITLWKK